MSSLPSLVNIQLLVDLYSGLFFDTIIEVRLLQAINAVLSIVVTLSGITIDCKLVHPSYLQPIITQYFIDNKSEIWLLFLIAHSKR